MENSKKKTPPRKQDRPSRDQDGQFEESALNEDEAMDGAIENGAQVMPVPDEE